MRLTSSDCTASRIKKPVRLRVVLYPRRSYSRIAPSFSPITDRAILLLPRSLAVPSALSSRAVPSPSPLAGGLTTKDATKKFAPLRPVIQQH